MVNEQVRRDFQDFLDSDVGEGMYKDKIQAMKNKNETRLIVNFDHLAGPPAPYKNKILSKPMDYIPDFDLALRDVLSTIDSEYVRKMEKINDFHIGFEGAFGAHALNPRSLSSRFLGTLVSVEGIVTRTSLVRPKVRRSIHYCEATEQTITRDYRDATSLGPFFISNNVYPTKDDDGNLLTTEYGLSVYRDYQTVAIQEMPEKAPTGQLPRSVDVILDEDLVDKVKPGDRVQIIGIYRAIPSKNGNISSGIFKTVLIANNIKHLTKDAMNPMISDVDIFNIKEVAKRKDIFDLLGKSIAPSIYGHEKIKKALILLLLGGLEKNLPNGAHIRGDINILLVGDPSTAKSQLLRIIHSMANISVMTSGRGASGVGLTAAVVEDKDSNERRLEAGAMVLADRGIVCIDEFDKMTDHDRVALHEVMEQQTVTIAKAGIHCSLNARCSVIAAANPVYGQYNKQKRPTENIGLADSLLSRFDLLFIVLDHLNPTHDRQISTHVLRLHQYRSPQEEDGGPVREDVNNFDEEEQIEEEPIFLHYENTLGKRKTKDSQEILSISFLKKYIHYAKQRMRPKLTAEAAEEISSTYCHLRSLSDQTREKTLPITARTLENLIRLSTAHAKARLSQTIEQEDAEVAKELIQFALYNETDVEKQKKKKKNQAPEDDDENEKTQQKEPEKRVQRKRKLVEKPSEMEEDDDEVPLSRKRKRDEPLLSTSQSSKTSQMEIDHPTSSSSSSNVVLTQDRIQLFRDTLVQTSIKAHKEIISLEEALAEVNEKTNNPYSSAEAEMILAQLQGENKVFFQDDYIYLL